jgi:hypothetical protein
MRALKRSNMKRPRLTIAPRCLGALAILAAAPMSEAVHPVAHRAIPYQEVSGPFPLRAEPEALDFGFVRPGQDRTGRVTLTNTSSEPVTIAAIQPTCTCTTTTELAGTVLPPGESVSFEATLAGAEVPGPKRASLKVVAEGAPRVLEIRVRAEVSDAVRAVPMAIEPPPNGPFEGRIVIESLDRQPFSVLSSDRRAPSFIGFDPKRFNPDSLYVIRTDLGERPPDQVPALWLIETDRADCPVIAVRVREPSKVVPAVLRLPEYVLSMGAFRPGETREIELLSNEPLEPDAQVRGGGPIALRVVGGEQVGRRWRLRMQATASSRSTGAFLTEVEVQVGDRVQRLPAYGTVRGEAVPDAAAAAQR